MIQGNRVHSPGLREDEAGAVLGQDSIPPRSRVTYVDDDSKLPDATEDIVPDTWGAEAYVRPLSDLQALGHQHTGSAWAAPTLQVTGSQRDTVNGALPGEALRKPWGRQAAPAPAYPRSVQRCSETMSPLCLSPSLSICAAMWWTEVEIFSRGKDLAGCSSEIQGKNTRV
jgi:hypothetical protein